MIKQPFAAEHVDNLTQGYGALMWVLAGVIEALDEGDTKRAKAVLERELEALRAFFIAH